MMRWTFLITVLLPCFAAGCQGESTPKIPPGEKAVVKQEPKWAKELAAFQLGLRMTEIAEANLNARDPEKRVRLEREASALAETQ